MELAHLALEIGEVLEALVDRSEAQVGDVVEPAEPLEHGHPDPVARDLAADCPQLLFDVGDQPVDRGVVEASGRGALDPGTELRRQERFGRARPLADDEGRFFDPLIGREPATARQAFAPTTNGHRLRRLARVDHLVVVRPAVRTAHEKPR